MAIAWVDGASANATTVALPGTAAAGDLAIVVAGRANTGGPSIPSGWTDGGVQAGGSGGSQHGSRLGWKILVAADITAGDVGTWANAVQIAVGVYSGADAVANITSAGGSSTDVSLPARTGLAATSWQVGAATHRNSGANTLATRTAADYTTRSSAWTSANAGIYDSNATTTGIAARTLTVSTSSGWGGWTMEVTEAAVAPNDGFGVVAGVGAVAGVGSAVHSGDGVVSGIGIVVGAGSAVHSGDGVVAGVGAVAGVGSAVHSGDGVIAGVGTVAGAGRAVHSGDGVVSGIGTVAGAGSVKAVAFTEFRGGAIVGFRYGPFTHAAPGGVSFPPLRPTRRFASHLAR